LPPMGHNSEKITTARGKDPSIVAHE
jgi:hypothetical protein